MSEQINAYTNKYWTLRFQTLWRDFHRFSSSASPHLLLGVFPILLSFLFILLRFYRKGSILLRNFWLHFLVMSSDYHVINMRLRIPPAFRPHRPSPAYTSDVAALFHTLSGPFHSTQHLLWTFGCSLSHGKPHRRTSIYWWAKVNPYSSTFHFNQS